MRRERADNDPIQLPPLHETIDGNALETLFEASPNWDGNVSFPLADVRVTVYATGNIVVTERRSVATEH